MKQLLKPGHKSSEFKLLVSVLVFLFGSNIFGLDLNAETFEQIREAIHKTTQGGSLNAIILIVLGYFAKRGWLKSKEMEHIRDITLKSGVVKNDRGDPDG